MKPNEETITIQEVIEHGCIERLKDISAPIRYKETVHIPIEQVIGNLHVVLSAVNGLIDKYNDLAAENDRLINKCYDLEAENNRLTAAEEVESTEEEVDAEPESTNE